MRIVFVITIAGPIKKVRSASERETDSEAEVVAKEVLAADRRGWRAGLE
jgi:hypothetical protein